MIRLWSWKESKTISYLNSVVQEAYQGETLLNEKMDGDFPVLKPGNNMISWTGDVEKVVIQPNWRFLA